MGVSLQIVRGEHEGRHFEIRGESVAVIGRGPEATISLDDPLLSRAHCKLEFAPSAIRLTDLRSTNGTYLNKHRIEEAELRAPDFFQAGSNLFRVVPTSRRFISNGKTFVCPRCREEVPMPEEAKGEERNGGTETVCPHCARPTVLGREVIGDYQLLEVIGKGATGLVYKAIDLREDSVVALKSLPLDGEVDSKTVSRYFRVSHTEGKLFHPNIVQVFRAGKVNGHFAIAMEFVEGITLYQRIVEEENLGVRASLEVAMQIASALIHAESKGVVHRDVKPENIIWTTGNRVKLMDFSIAKKIRQESEVQVTLAGEGLGTLYYVPPEQIYNAANVDSRADVYALGCTLYHMLTGWPPFKEDKGHGKKQGVLIRILSGEYVPVEEYAPSVPEDVIQVVEKAMAREVAERYESPKDFLADLRMLYRKH